jgi:hypothetical protein
MYYLHKNTKVTSGSWRIEALTKRTYLQCSHFSAFFFVLFEEQFWIQKWKAMNEWTVQPREKMTNNQYIRHGIFFHFLFFMAGVPMRFKQKKKKKEAQYKEKEDRRKCSNIWYSVQEVGSTWFQPRLTETEEKDAGPFHFSFLGGIVSTNYQKQNERHTGARFYCSLARRAEQDNLAPTVKLDWLPNGCERKGVGRWWMESQQVPEQCMWWIAASDDRENEARSYL